MPFDHDHFHKKFYEMHKEATRAVGRTFGVWAVVALALNLAFWLGLIAGAFWLVKRFFF